MSIDEGCNISISTSLDRYEIADLLTTVGPGEDEISGAIRDLFHISVWPKKVSHWPRDEIGSLAHLEVSIWGFETHMEQSGLMTRADTATFYASKILRLLTHDRVEAGLARDTSYAAWTFWSPSVTAVVDNKMPGDSRSNEHARVGLANFLYVPEIESRYKEQAIAFERRTFTEAWQIEETSQHSLFPIRNTSP